MKKEEQDRYEWLIKNNFKRNDKNMNWVMFDSPGSNYSISQHAVENYSDMEWFDFIDSYENWFSF